MTPSTAPTTKQSTSNNSTHHKPRLSSILGSFLETSIHELLYLRSLYPHDAFSPSRHLQISVHACRHPAVVDYIYDTLKVAVPSILNSEADALYLIFWDEATSEVYERYSFEFDRFMTGSQQVDNYYQQEQKDIGEIVRELERSLRDVLLSIMSLEGSELGRKRGMKTFPDSATFKLCLHTKKSNNESSVEKYNSTTSASFPGPDDHDFCPELKEAIESGKWMRSDSKSCHLQSQGINSSGIIQDSEDAAGDNNQTERNAGCISRPLKSLNAPSCGLKMQLVMDFKNSLFTPH